MMDETTTKTPAAAKVTEPKSGSRPDADERTADERERLRLFGLAIMSRLFAASKTVRMYEMNNRAVQRSLRDLEEAVQGLIAAEGRVAIRLSSDLLLFNDQRIAVDAQHYELALCRVDRHGRGRCARHGHGQEQREDARHQAACSTSRTRPVM